MCQDLTRALTAPQIRAARALLKWSAEDLSRHSSVSLRTIRRAELAERHTTLTAANNLAVRRALESAGVEFTNGDQPGVRLTGAAAAHSGRKRGEADEKKQ
jgi:transcriptional regulator with XRE-family HTH domain